MARNYYNGIYAPKNMDKYVGTKNPTFRSGWEYKVFAFLDTHPSVVKWGSEVVKIPYQDPFTGKARTYIPDLLVEFVDAKGKKKVQLIEIKPIRQSTMEKAKTLSDKKAVILNEAKWASATFWAKSNGITFRVMTEKDIYLG